MLSNKDMEKLLDKLNEPHIRNIIDKLLFIMLLFLMLVGIYATIIFQLAMYEKYGSKGERVIRASFKVTQKLPTFIIVKQ